jgi:hypothetical protein
MELKSSLILLPLLMASPNLSGASKPEMLLSPITTSQLASTALELKYTPTNSQVVTPNVLTTTSVTFMEAATSQLPMDLELQVCVEQEMDY